MQRTRTGTATTASSEPRYKTPILYRVMLRIAVPAVLATWVKVDVQGRENIPERGPLILIANHVDNNDTYAIGRYVPFTIHFLARPAGMHSRVLGRYWRRMAAISADREGLSQAMALLKAGEVVGIFPDGVITPRLLRAKAGVAALAARAGVPVLPVAVWGTEQVRIWPLPRGRRRTIHIRFGDPRTVSRADARGGLQQLADSLMTDVAEMLPPQYRGYYAEAAELDQVASVPPDTPSVERNGAGGLHHAAQATTNMAGEADGVDGAGGTDRTDTMDAEGRAAEKERT